MKRLCLLLAMIFVLSMAFSVLAYAAESEIGGYIALADEADARLVAAGDTLAKYMKQVTGSNFVIAEDGNGLRFEIGYSSALADNGYLIETYENKVTITGNGTRGVVHGVYAFLNKYCGCNWFTSSLYSIPENKNLTIPEGEKTEYKPFFEYTDTDWLSPRDVEYSLANGLNGSPYRAIPDELGGTVEYISAFCHTLGSQFCSRDTYFESNPEYFALHNGIRQNEQLCLTHEDVYNLVLSEVMALLKERHDPQKSLQIISITQADSGENAKMCQCDSCKAIDEANGSHSGTMITFANRIARAVKAAGYDNVAIDTFAYRYTRKAPTQVVPDDNVIVRLCTIECCFAHSLDDAGCTENVALMQDLKDWSKICNRIYIWDYATNYAHTLGVFPDFGVLQRNIQVFYENNVAGVYEEGNYYMAECDGELGELRAYLLSRLMQNPYIDYNACMNEFLEAYYGGGWQSIRQFLDMTMEKAVPEGQHLGIYVTMAQTLGFNKDDIAKADALWEDAKKGAQTESQLLNVKRSEICWRYWKGFNAYNAGEVAQLISDMKQMGITKVAESDQVGPDGIAFHNAKATAFGDKVLFPLSIVLYAVTIALAAAVMVLALKKKPRKYQYIPLTVLIGAFFEIFSWHKRASVSFNSGDSIITFILILVLFAIGGAILWTGVKNRIAAAILCPVIWGGLYVAAYLAINALLGGAITVIISVAFILAGIEAIVMLLTALRRQIKS